MEEGTYTTMTTAGVRGASWYCEDADEAEALAREHGYDVRDVYMEDEGQWVLVVAG